MLSVLVQENHCWNVMNGVPMTGWLCPAVLLHLLGAGHAVHHTLVGGGDRPVGDCAVCHYGNNFPRAGGFRLLPEGKKFLSRFFEKSDFFLLLIVRITSFQDSLQTLAP